MYACLHAAGNTRLLVECARHFSPLVEETSADTVVFDVRGMGVLIGDAHQIAAAIAGRAGIPVSVAVAHDPDTVTIAARGIRGITVVERGREAEQLASLPLNLLPGSPDIAALLDAWGIRTLGELAALPPLGVEARLGAEGSYLRRIARGEEHRRLRIAEDALIFEEEYEPDYPIELLEPLAFLFSRMLGDLCARLTFHSLAADEVRLVLMLENASPHICNLRLPVPMREVKTLLKLLQLELNTRPPGAPVVKIRIELHPEKPRTEQQGLFLAQAPEPARLEVTLARLVNLLGSENVGAPEILNTHRPDAFRMDRYNPAAISHNEGGSVLPEAVLALRRFRPPLHAQVRFLNEKPAHIAAGSLRGKVLSAAGPWRSSGEWWKDTKWDHAEWDIALDDGALYRVYEDSLTGRWFVEGSYD